MFSELTFHLAFEMARNIILMGNRGEILVEKTGFPIHELQEGFVRNRMLWMLPSNEWMRFTCDGGRILLESWSVARTVHTLVREYGELSTYEIKWKQNRIPLNIVEIHEYHDMLSLPMTVPTGHGAGFLVSAKTLRAFWKMVEEEDRDPMNLGARARLLYHCIIDRRVIPELSIDSFMEFDGTEVLSLVESWDGMSPGHGWSRYTATEAGFVDGHDVSVIEVAKEEGNDSGGVKEKIRKDTEAEPVKMRGKTGGLGQGDKEGSPELAEATAAAAPVLNDMDVEWRPRLRGAKRRRYRRRLLRNQGRQVKQEGGPTMMEDPVVKAEMPRKLTKEQEMWVMRMLILGVKPDASEELILRNQQEYYAARVRKEKAFAKYSHYPAFINLEAHQECMMGFGAYGSGPGGWSLSNQEKKETMEEIKTVEKEMKVESEKEKEKKEEVKLDEGMLENVTLDENDGSFESFVSMVTNSSRLTSPRGESSMMGQALVTPTKEDGSPGTSGSSGSSAPAKRMRVNLSISSSLSEMPEMSPMMASAFLDREVVTISSESEEEIKKRVRKMSLYQLAATNFLVYVDDANLGEEKKKDEEEEVFGDGLDDNGNESVGSGEEASEGNQGGGGDEEMDEDHEGDVEDEGHTEEEDKGKKKEESKEEVEEESSECEMEEEEYGPHPEFGTVREYPIIFGPNDPWL